MIQSKKINDSVYKIGCLGKINDYQKSKDGRVLINLSGITRFEIQEEIANDKLYREFRVNYENFTDDLSEEKVEVNPSNLMTKAKVFFKRSGLLLNWMEFEKLDIKQKINTLAMISPINSEEKQKILEAISTNEKVSALENIISFYLHEGSHNNQTIQ